MSSDESALHAPANLGWPLHLPDNLGWLFTHGRGRGRQRPDDLERFAALQRIAGGGPFGGPMFGHPFGGGRGRKRRGDVRLALLLLLAEEPRNGYQLMQAIEERSDGRWRPSPGSVYPTLAQLEDEALIRAAQRDGTKVFELTDAGRAHLDERGDAAPPWEVGDESGANSFREIRGLMVQVVKAASQVAQVGDERQLERACETLAEARRSLYRILADEEDA